MKKLPEDLKVLKIIGEKLDKLMSDTYTSVEIRSTDLYDYAKNDKLLSSKFPTQREFNQFLRKQHDKGYLNQLIPNCRVDTTNKEFYQWHFRKKSKSKTEKRKKGINGNYIHFRENLNIQTSDNTFVRSEQEKMIYESILSNEHLEVVYDYPLIINGKRKNVDFYIENKIDQTEYYWEHFGMTNNEGYLSKIPKTIRWYKEAGFKDISEKNGNLIFTYYHDLKVFQREINKNLSKILNRDFKPKVYSTNKEESIVNIYISTKINESNGKGWYAMILTYERENLKHQKNFTKSFYLAPQEKIVLTAVEDGLKKLKKPVTVKINLTSDRLINSITKQNSKSQWSSIIDDIIEFSKTHQISFRKIYNPTLNRFYLETQELLSYD